MEQMTIALDIKDTLLCRGLTQLISQMENFSYVQDKCDAQTVVTDHMVKADKNDTSYYHIMPDGPVSARRFFPDLIKASQENIAYPIQGDRFYPFLKKIILQNGDAISLTDLENDLLLFLYEHKDEHCSKDDLLKNVWQYHQDVTTHTVETHIYRLRQKYPLLENILSTRESGYMLYLKGEDD